MANLVVNGNNYKVDNLYQWDVNQVLEIHGLSIVEPEIHFANEVMSCAIVGKSTVDNKGIIRADVPNSLLQKPYAITVFICGYEGETFKTYCKVRVPVQARTKPGDYTLAVTDMEVYSFNELTRSVSDMGLLLNEGLTRIEDLEVDVDTALSIAKGRNQARVFATTEAMYTWLKNKANAGVCNVGDNIYIVDTGVPDWWISKVLTSANGDGYYYEIAQLETQKVDLTPYDEAIVTINNAIAETNENIEGIIDGTIGENLLIYPYNETTHTDNGITWTDNGDGTVKANGTATANSALNCRSRNEITNQLILSAGTYTLSGCPTGGSDSTYYMQVGRTLDGAFNSLGKDYGEGVTFTLTEDTQIQIQCSVYKSATVSNIVFKPMLEVGEIAHEYQPYAKSRQSIIDQIVVDNLIDSNFKAGWVRTTEYSYESGKVVLAKDSDTSGISYHCKDYYFEKGKTYTVSAKVNTSETSGGFISIMYNDGSTFKTLINSNRTMSGKCKVTFTVPNDANYMRITFAMYNPSATEGTEITFSEMMLEEGAVAHSYRPYKKGLSRVCERVETMLDNLLPYPYYDTTKTFNGVTCTDKGNGSIAFTGTASADVTFLCSSRSDTTEPFKLAPGTYLLAGCPSGGSEGTYKTTVGKIQDGAYKAIAVDYGEGVIFALTEETILQISPVIKNGATVNNLIFTPVIRNVMSNPVLREDLDTLLEDTGWLTLVEAGATLLDGITIDEDIRYRIIRNKLYIAGKVSYSGGADVLGAIVPLGTLPSDIGLKSCERVFAYKVAENHIATFAIKTLANGNVMFSMAKNVGSVSTSLYQVYFEECFLLD